MNALFLSSMILIRAKKLRLNRATRAFSERKKEYMHFASFNCHVAYPLIRPSLSIVCVTKPFVISKVIYNLFLEAQASTLQRTVPIAQTGYISSNL